MPRYQSTTIFLEAILSSSFSASKMKNKASAFLKQVFSVIVTMVKAKSTAVKSKTSAIKTRLIIFSLLRNKKVLMNTINHKIHALMGHDKGRDGGGATTVANEEYNKAIVMYNAAKDKATLTPIHTGYGEEEEEEDEYPDLTHSLFDLGDEDDELDNGTGSVIEMVKNSREDSANFVLEDEIDHVADMFIKRFHRQMRIQKQDSFKRYQEMLQRGV